ncbi:hypothetical protein D3C81_1896780 [compost metagenome]
MDIPGVEDGNVPRIDDVLLIFADQKPLSRLNKPDDIIVVEMVGELLHDSLKPVSFDFQLRIITYGPFFLGHATSLRFGFD